MIRDRNIQWKRKPWYIRGQEFSLWNTMAEATGTGSSQNIAHLLGATPNIVIATQTEQDTTASDIAYGTHDGTNVKITQPDAAQKAIVSAAVAPTEYSTFGFGGIHIQTAGDLYTTYQMVPWDLDPNYPIGIKVHYCGAAAVADIFDWICLLDFKASGTALAAPSTALDTVISVTGTKTATANSHDWSSRGVKNSGFLTTDQIEAGSAMLMSIELDSTQSTLASEECHLLGVLVDYVPYKTRGGGSGSDAMLTATGAT